MKANSLLKELDGIVISIYEVADRLGADHEDEIWRTASKLKNVAIDAYFYVAMVVGAGKNPALEFDCVNARKFLSVLRDMYILSSKQGLIELDPELVLKIDNVITKIDSEQEKSKEEFKRISEEELKPWLEKYRIWQKISRD